MQRGLTWWEGNVAVRVRSMYWVRWGEHWAMPTRLCNMPECGSPIDTWHHVVYTGSFARVGPRWTSWTGNPHPVDERREPGLMEVNKTRPQPLVDLVWAPRRVRDSILIYGPAQTLQGRMAETRANRQPAVPALCQPSSCGRPRPPEFGKFWPSSAERR